MAHDYFIMKLYFKSIPVKFRLEKKEKYSRVIARTI